MSKLIDFFCPYCGNKTCIPEKSNPFGKKKKCSKCNGIFPLSQKTKQPKKQKVSAKQTKSLIQNRYKVEKVLGRGNMGEVYQALDTKLNRQVAIKQLSPKDGKNTPKLIARARREYSFLFSIKHPNIVEAYDFFCENQKLYLVLEFVSGISLADFIKTASKSIPISEQLAIAIQIAQAVEVLNVGGILHRDIKPANVVLNEEIKRVKLLDLGIAKSLELDPNQEKLTLPGCIIGTPNYISPEQILSESAPNSDVFALGTTLYQFFLWQHSSPYKAKGVMGSFQNILKLQLPPLVQKMTTSSDKERDVIKKLSTVIAKSMIKDHLKRTASAKELADVNIVKVGLQKNIRLNSKCFFKLCNPIKFKSDWELVRQYRVG